MADWMADFGLCGEQRLRSFKAAAMSTSQNAATPTLNNLLKAPAPSLHGKPSQLAASGIFPSNVYLPPGPQIRLVNGSAPRRPNSEAGGDSRPSSTASAASEKAAVHANVAGLRHESSVPSPRCSSPAGGGVPASPLNNGSQPRHSPVSPAVANAYRHPVPAAQFQHPANFASASGQAGPSQAPQYYMPPQQGVPFGPRFGHPDAMQRAVFPAEQQAAHGYPPHFRMPQPGALPAYPYRYSLPPGAAVPQRAAAPTAAEMAEAQRRHANPPPQPTSEAAWARVDASSLPSTPGTQSPGGASMADDSLDQSSLSSPSWPHTPVTAHRLPPPMNSGKPLSAKESALVDKLTSESRYNYPEEFVIKRRVFYEALVRFCEASGNPLTTLPTVSKQVVDLHRLYLAVREQGGFERVTKNKMWKTIITGVNNEMAESSAAGYQLRRHYIKHLLAFECAETGGDPSELIEFAERQKKSKKRRTPAPVDAPPPPNALPPQPQQPPMPHQPMPPQQSMGHAYMSEPNAYFPPPPWMGPHGQPYPGAPPQPMQGQAAAYAAHAAAQPMVSAQNRPAQQLPQQQQEQQSLDGATPPANVAPSSSASDSCQRPLPAAATSAAPPPPPSAATPMVARDPFDDRGCGSAVVQRPPISQVASLPAAVSSLSGPSDAPSPISSGGKQPTSTASEPPTPPAIESQSSVGADEATAAVVSESSRSFASPAVARPPSNMSTSSQPPQQATSAAVVAASAPQPQTQIAMERYASQPAAPTHQHAYPVQHPQPQAYAQFGGAGYMHMQRAMPMYRHPSYAGHYGASPQANVVYQQQAYVQQAYPMSGGADAAAAAAAYYPSTSLAAPAYASQHAVSQSQWPPQRVNAPSNHQQALPFPAGPSSFPQPTHSHYYQQQQQQQQQQMQQRDARSFQAAQTSGGQRRDGAPLFPPNCVEATQINPASRRRKLTTKDVGKLDAWRLVMALKSGVELESHWALNVLNILLYDDSSVLYFFLRNLPGLLEVLIENFRCCLTQLFAETDFDRVTTPLTTCDLTATEASSPSGCDDATDEMRRGAVVAESAANNNDSTDLNRYSRTRVPIRFKQARLATRPRKRAASYSTRRNGSLCRLAKCSHFCAKRLRFDTDGEAETSNELSAASPDCANNAPPFFYQSSDAATATLEESDELSAPLQLPVIDADDLKRDLTWRCLALSNCIRGLAFIPGNEIPMAKNEDLLLLIGRLLLLGHRHVATAARLLQGGADDAAPVKARGTSAQLDAALGDSVSALRDDAFVVLCHLSVQLDLVALDSDVSRALLDGLLHWCVCRTAEAKDPLIGNGVSPLHYSLEILCKMSVIEHNVDLALATGPWARMERLCRVLAQLLSLGQETHVREFALVLVNAFCSASRAAATVCVVHTPAVHHLVSFLELADNNMHQVMTQHGMPVLRENPELMGTSVGMLRRAAGVLQLLAKIGVGRARFARHHPRLLQFTMSHLMDSLVAAIVANTLFELQTPPSAEEAALACLITAEAPPSVALAESPSPPTSRPDSTNNAEQY